MFKLAVQDGLCEGHSGRDKMLEGKQNSVEKWVEDISRITKPDKVVFCDGSKEEYDRLIKEMVDDGDLIKLNQETYPGGYLSRSDPKDVARTEKSTFICADEESQVGPLNNHMNLQEAEEITGKLMNGSMKGKTMYVVPYVMGPIDSPYSEVGVEITDNRYVVVNMYIMTRMGKVAMDRIKEDGKFVRAVHISGTLDPENRYILHFPWKRLDIDAHIVSINSAYGGNALLSKKCHALRIASVEAKNEGWMAEHMLILEIENPEGKKYYFAAAFPSASGKTNLAMLMPPEGYAQKGWKARLIGDDIAWIHLGKDGRLYAINPENGFFGVVPGTNAKTNPNAMRSIRKDTIFTNVALTEKNEPWWEGLPYPEGKLYDWQGNIHKPDTRQKAAHPNSRFTTPLNKYPSLSNEVENPEGVPLTAILFGGRRGDTIPLVFESMDWKHGVFLGATMGVEQTAAAEGQVGVVRRDPMAMKPFCGYNASHYFQHWLTMGQKSDKLPGIYYVNWFRKDKDGNFIWPGFGENLRVLEWIIGRSEGRASARDTPIGRLPDTSSLNYEGLSLTEEQKKMLFAIDYGEWSSEITEMEDYIRSLGKELPEEIRKQMSRLRERMGS